MRSASTDSDSDFTSRARIRDAAIDLFGRQGYNGTGMRAIAAAAGVSPALVIHHFGSKEGLVEACDEYVAAVMHKAKVDATAPGPPDPLQVLRTVDYIQPLLGYIARMLVDGSPGVDRLVDAMVADADAHMREGVEAGFLRPTKMAHQRAVLLSIWQLGAVALHEHVRRLLNIDLLGDPDGLLEWGRPALELMTHGLFTDDSWERALAANPQTAPTEEEP